MICTEEKLVVETKKGTYTLPNEDWVVGRCDAEEKCASMGAMLAPFTDKSEFDTVIKAIKSCEDHDQYEPKLVGLIIAKNNSSRIFSNGIEFD